MKVVNASLLVALLSVAEAFKKDPSPQKINLGVGAYRTEEGKPLVLNVVRQAEQRIVSNPNENKVSPAVLGATSALCCITSSALRGVWTVTGLQSGQALSSC